MRCVAIVVYIVNQLGTGEKYVDILRYMIVSM